MPRYKIIGADRQTGEPVSTVLVADSEEAAIRDAGFLVSSINLIPDQLPEDRSEDGIAFSKITPQPPDSHTTSTPNTKNCPCCAEPILAAAKKCKHCGEYLEQSQQGLPSISVASVFGGVVAAIGFIVMIIGWVMDTTVATGSGRVHNIGLQQDRTITVIVGIAIAVVGILVAILMRSGTRSGAHGVVSQPSTYEDKTHVLIVAKNQKFLMWSMFGHIFAYILLGLTEHIGFLAVVLVILAQAPFVFKIALVTFTRSTGIALAVLSLVPYLGLIQLVVINAVATKRLKASGLTVGLWGVPASEISTLEVEQIKAYRT